MEADRPSRTAAYVAALRGLGVLLPEPGRLIDDPWGAAWTGVERLRLKGLGLQVFEVDHPATQARKRPLVGDAATLVPWDFEREPLGGLPPALASRLREDPRRIAVAVRSGAP
ncbi:MAG TPA: hypothetical protein VIG99_32905 [Myxococcaceae bacterium]|jgi:hypothetical protein